MSHDPWMEDSNSLDLTDSAEDRVHVPFAFTRDHADWLTADDQANFARGTEASVTQSQEDAYAAMAMQDTLCSPLGLDSARPTLALSDVRAQPSKKDDGYATLGTEGDLPDTTAIIQRLMLHRDLIMSNQMIYLIVDNRTPTDVPHWPAFAAWWASRRCLVGPQEEATDILWVCADATTGLHKVPYYWAGVFVLEAARFLYPAQHFALIDNDCVPVTLFEVQDLLQLAHQQHQWVDLIGCARSESSSCAGIGMLLFTEAHLEYNAGLVISIGNRSKHSPLEYDTTASALAKNLQAGRLALVSRARPPVNPSDTAISGTMFTPFVGIAMQTALDLCMVWSLYGLYMCKHFWPSPVTSPDELGPGGTIKWPRQSHPNALTPEGRERTRGSPAGLALPSNREYCQCSQCLQGHAQSRHCQVNTSSRPVRCRATVCDLPYFMPLARPKLERRMLYENWSSRVGKRYRSLYSACPICPQHGSLRLGNQ